jgi:predicted acyltransferase (DUF342 family)
MPFWAPLALTSATAALLALPVTPALYELRKRRDAAPLPTSRHDGRIGNFAQALRMRLEPLRPQLELCRTKNGICRTNADGMEVLLVGRDSFDFNPSLMEGIAAVMCSQDALVPAGSVIEADVYSEGTLELGEGAAIRAALGAGDIVMGRNSSALRWLHADSNAYLCHGSTAYGRLSAGLTIRLERGCCFQRMHAPQILTVDADHADPASQVARGFLPSKPHACEAIAGPENSAADAHDLFATSRPRMRIEGNFFLPPGETLNANVIATGDVRFGAGSRFFGSAKSYKDTVLEEDSCAHGSIVCGQTLHLGLRSFVAGPIMAEGDVVMARGSCVGGPDALTTLSSHGASISAGCQLYGTVWARVRGSVED